METNDLHENYNMKMAAISALYSVVNTINDKIQKLQKESEEIMEKISNEGIRESDHRERT